MKKAKNNQPKSKKAIIIAACVVGAIILIGAIGGAGKSSQDTAKTDGSTSKSGKWSEMTIGDKEFLASTACEEAVVYSGKINTNQFDIVSLRDSWDSWIAYGDEKAVVDAAVVSKTASGLPIYSYSWRGNYKEDKDSYKETVTFNCYFSVDEANDNKIDVIWLTLEETNIIGDQSLVFAE